MEIPAAVREFPRIVKPRSTGYKHHDIVAISNDKVLTEHGEELSTYTFIRTLPSYKIPLLVVKQNVAEFVAACDELYGEHAAWQWRATAKREEIWTPNVNVKSDIEKTIIHYFGWKTGLFHLAIDPVTFYGRSIDDIIAGDMPRERKLLLWATELREFCRANNLALKPTNGSVSAQFLRDIRFYPDDRRKVPKATNDTIREHLPGNHYRLYIPEGTDREYQAFYLDQRRAHHYHAQHTPLPDANSLFAYGRFRTLGSPVYPGVFPEFHGLYFADIYTRQIPRNDPFGLFRCKEHSFSAFIYSNEVSYLQARGYEIRGVRAAWGSKHVDTGLPRYAEWACSQLDKYEDAKWLKPILLSTYGILAAAPSDMSFAYKHTTSTETPITLLAGHRRLHGYLVSHTRGRKLDSKIANVLQRGLIEAATRIETLQCAEFFHQYSGMRLLQIYADAVIVEDDGSVNPDSLLLPDPWRLHQRLHHYRPINSQAFVSGEMVRLPGVTGQQRVRYSIGGNKNVPIKPYYDAGTGRKIGLAEQKQRGLKVRHI